MGGRLLAQSSSFPLKSDGWVKRHIDIAVATQGIGFAGKAAVLDSGAVLALGIQFAGQQLGFQCLDDLRESQVELGYLRLTPLTDQTGSIG